MTTKQHRALHRYGKAIEKIQDEWSRDIDAAHNRRLLAEGKAIDALYRAIPEMEPRFER